MYYTLGIKPFNDFWINCIFNMKYSILTTLEPSIKQNACLNMYEYKDHVISTPTGNTVGYLQIENHYTLSSVWKSDSTFNIKPFKFNLHDNPIERVQDEVMKRKFVLVGVDLFNWIPNSICYHKHHWTHYSLINGFDTQKQCFYVLDDNRKGFDEHSITYDNFLDAIANSNLSPNGLLLELQKVHCDNQIKDIDIKTNAIKIINSIDNIDSSLLFGFNKEDIQEYHMMDLFTMYINQIQNRQKANLLLLKRLKEEKIISDTLTHENLINYSRNLYKDWSIIKSKFVKVFYTTDYKNAINDVNILCKNALYAEKLLWNSLIISI